MDDETRFIVDPEVLVRTLDGQILLLNRSTLESFGLDEAAVAIWEAIARGLTFAEICAQCAASSGAPLAMVRPDTDAFLGDLLAAGLIRKHIA